MAKRSHESPLIHAANEIALHYTVFRQATLSFGNRYVNRVPFGNILGPCYDRNDRNGGITIPNIVLVADTRSCLIRFASDGRVQVYFQNPSLSPRQPGTAGHRPAPCSA